MPAAVGAYVVVAAGALQLGDVVMVDISERKQIETERERKQRERASVEAALAACDGKIPESEASKKAGLDLSGSGAAPPTRCASSSGA